jgi:hypothetical protein
VAPPIDQRGFAVCRPFDPESKGGTEATVKIAKADLVPALVNLAPEYGSFADLEEACAAWCGRVNARIHRERPRSLISG